MVKYAQAALGLVLLAASGSNAFVSPRSRIGAPTTAMRRSVSASQQLDQFDQFDEDNRKIRETLESLGQSVSDAITASDEADLDDEARVELKKRLMRQRLAPAGRTVKLSLSSKVGVRLCQVEPGIRISKQTLDFDSLTFGEAASAGKTIETFDKDVLEDRLDPNFRGLVVQSVDTGGQGYAQGIRPGDLLMASSATVGDGMWPKTTLEGLKSGIASRKVVSDSLTMQVQPSAAEATKVDNQYELSMTRPMGFEVGEDGNGYVVVTGFNENVSKLVRYAVQEGDRIVAVSSTLGNQMWPVSTVEGVISASTAKLPGQKVKMRFERPQAVLDKVAGQQTSTGATQAGASTKPAAAAITNEKRQILLQRSQDVLKRYTVESQDDFVGKYAVPVMVADKVVDAIASASTSFDSTTLSMVMTSYLSCHETDKAIRIFEATTGLRADGSSEPADVIVNGSELGVLAPNEAALNVYTASSVLHAMAMKGDLSSAKRVLAALEGRDAVMVDGKLVAAWPGSGTTLVPDTTCYNNVLSAAAATRDGLADLQLIFSSMVDGTNQKGLPTRDLFTYNTVIAALTNARRSDEAFEVFAQMKAAGIRPDKFTYTSLVKACSRPMDMQELLYDMKEKGVEPDIVTYNTMIRTLCDRLRWYEAKEMITDMEANGVAPNSMTYGFLMTGLVKAEKYSACIALFESACADARTIPLTENVHLYTTAISAAASLRNYEKAFHLINRMNMSGVRPNIKTLTAVMSACLSSGQTSLAVDLYKQIAEPDSKAMTKGVEAMCIEGHFDEANELLHQQWRTKGSVLNGKQIMQGYTTLMSEALQQGNLDCARTAFTRFLAMGFIPSKVMFHAIVDGLGCAPPTRKKNHALVKEIPEENFDYLLFVLDSLGGRNLACDGYFYSAVLRCGSRLGRLRRKVGSLLAEARANTASGEPLPGQDGETIGWEDLLHNYDEYKNGDRQIHLPTLRVNVNKAQVRSVLFAEQKVTYGGRKASWKTSKRAAQNRAFAA